MKTVEDLQYNGLRIIVDKQGFTYGRDAVLLANFAKPGAGERCLDLGAGTGILSILINGKTGASFTAVELQEEAARTMAESVALNAQQQYIRVLSADLRELRTLLPPGSFDCAVCNPPYYSGGTKSGNPSVSLSTHQEQCTMEDVAACAGAMLKNGGRLWMCYPAERLAECFWALVKNGVEPKRVQLVHGRGSRPYLALIEAKKGGKTGLIWEQPITEQ